MSKLKKSMTAFIVQRPGFNGVFVWKQKKNFFEKSCQVEFLIILWTWHGFCLKPSHFDLSILELPSNYFDITCMANG